MSRRANGEGSIYPYRNGFAAHVWITTPAGRRQRKSVYGKTRAEVHQKWLQLHERARRGPVVPVSPSLRAFLERWLAETVRPGLSPATASNYEMFARLYIVPDLGDRKLEKLTVRDVQAWVNALRVRCQCCFQGKDAALPEPQCCAVGKCCQEVASDWTVHQAWRVLRGALTQAMREELVYRNVAALVRVPVPRAKKSAVWTVDEARQFLESARADGDPMYAAYVLLLVLGLRRGEMLGLAWEDVDLEHGEALIAWQVQRVDGQLLRRRTKTPSSDAPLPLPDIAVRALERHRLEESRRRLAAGEMWADCGLVFTTRLGDPIDPRNFHRAFKTRAEKAGVPVIPVHATRRTCASLLVSLEVHPRVAMAVLRHSRIALTMEVYSQVSSRATRDALHQLGGRLGDGSAV
ncbi:tyrosine-type recombinase/integrase [Ornithinicoccus halotolerans]|uniref:tyrosine-type recombinase/integrase n=1 Tax=Ornithinicoccus halotolerans TaxID=1748220 RepID=UPI001295DBE5|nr:site-specific integrase [Ornithinicoccus halotolerans]